MKNVTVSTALPVPILTAAVDHKLNKRVSSFQGFAMRATGFWGLEHGWTQMDPDKN